MAFSIFALLGCTPTTQYRGDQRYVPGPDVASDTRPAQSPVGLIGTGYHLGIVEFDDQGELLSTPPQYEIVRKRVATDSSDGYRGKVVVVFAHGWFHNAAPQDPNLELLWTMLAMMAQNEKAVAAAEQRLPREIEGVYLAWRGGNSEVPGLRYLTFWNRKDTAHRIGERRVTEVILGLRDAAYTGPVNSDEVPNRFILMGHSFGGALIFSATSQLIANHLLDHPDLTTPRAPLADAIILFNPAFEAARTEHLFDTASLLKDRLPSLSIFTSKTDDATGVAFPTARFFDTLSLSYRSAMPNPIKPGTSYSQRQADIRTIGHFDPFMTHDLVVAKPDSPNCKTDTDMLTNTYAEVAVSKSGNPDLERQKAETIYKAQDKLMTAYEESSPVLNFGSTCLVQRSGLVRSQLAVFNVSMDADIWDGHGIDQTPDRTQLVLGFLEHFVPFAATAKTVPTAISPPAAAFTMQPRAGAITHSRRRARF